MGLYLQFAQSNHLHIPLRHYFLFLLGYNEPHKVIARHVDIDDGMKHPVIDSIGRKQQYRIVYDKALTVSGVRAFLCLEIWSDYVKARFS